MSAATGDDEGNGKSVHGAGEALVVVGVAGEDGVRPDAGGGTGRVDVGEQVGAAAMDRAAGEGRMMNGDDDRSGEFVRLDALERGGKEGDLALIEVGVGSVLVGDDAGIFEDIASRGRGCGRTERRR